jgi:DNA-binding NtrC family response regulator
MIPSLGSRPDEASRGRQRARRVLVVDEAPPVVRALVEALQKLGVPREDVRIAMGAHEALDAFRKDPPDVVFAELVGTRPEDGLEVVHEMLDAAPHVKVVLVTAEPRDSPEVRAAIRAGAFAFIEKPLRHDKIRQVMQDLESEEGGIERFR